MCHLCQQHLEAGGTLTAAAPNGTMEQILKIFCLVRKYLVEEFVRTGQFIQLSMCAMILLFHQQCNRHLNGSLSTVHNTAVLTLQYRS